MNQGSVTIILMNSGLVMFLLLWIFLDRDLPQTPPDHMTKYIDTQYYMYYLYYLISTVFPVVLAAYNPLVVCVRCGELRQSVRLLGVRWRGRLLGVRWRGRLGGSEVRGGTETTNVLSKRAELA